MRPPASSSARQWTRCGLRPRGTSRQLEGLHQSDGRRAFTAIELLAATALTALLLVAVLRVVGSLGRSRAALERRQQDSPAAWRADLIDTLRRDLTNSTAYRQDGGAVVLIGHATLDRGTLAPRDEPVVVTYVVSPVGGRSWLTRRQTPRDVRGGGTSAAWAELLCPDVAGFDVAPISPAGSGASRAPGTDEPQPLPRAVRVRIDGAGGPIVDEILRLD